MPTPRPAATCSPHGLRRSCIVEPANHDTGKIRCNVSTLDPDKLGNVVEIDPVDGCIVVDRPS